MILDHISNARRYAAVHPGIPVALDYLSQVTASEPGRKDIDGANVYALCSFEKGKRREQALLEAHRRYIDIHYCINGNEEIGWRALHNCTRRAKDYDEGRDCMTFNDAPESWCALHPGQFAVFFPEDAHAPMVGEGLIRKIVVKVAV